MAKSVVTEEPKKPKVPKWAVRPIDKLVDDAERLAGLLHISIQGISMLPGVPKFLKAMGKVKDEDPETTSTKHERAEGSAALAQKEIDEQFPLLHAQATIALWSLLEAACRHLAVNLIRNQRGARDAEAIQKIKISIAEYDSLDEEERAYFIIDCLDRGSSGPLKHGVGRFEALLSHFNLAGAIPSDLKSSLFELNQVRNVLVHRYGIADKKFVDACPQLGFASRDAVIVSHELFSKYHHAVIRYATILIVRIGESHGVDMREHKDPNLGETV